MQFDEAKKILREGYSNAGLEIADEHQKELYFKSPRKELPLVRLSEEEIKGFAEFGDLRSSFKAQPAECSMCSLTYILHQYI